MNISVKGEYALLAMLDLAARPPGATVKIGDIAQRQKIPRKFLEIILGSLKLGGFVESRRGAEGGYLLARPAESITAGEVLRYVEGHRRRSNGYGRPDSPFAELWREVDLSIAGVLDNRSFAVLARQWQDKQHKYVPNWEI